MFTRMLTVPEGSFFLFGPRGTGKSTWIRSNFPGSRYYDLLNTSELLRLARDPGALYREVAALPESSRVVIDEVQKAPVLLNEVHRLIEDRDCRFVLSGSSARKLRRGGTNLLAGRALVEHMFPLTSVEMEFRRKPFDTLCFGNLPLSVTGNDPEAFLTSYAETYLQEEIRAEALTRSIGDFSRFLEIAARQNGQVTNTASISRDAAVSRQTVQNYFDILVDTLAGSWLHPWKLKRSTKQVSHSKFYLFDCGVARALTGRIAYPPAREEQGALLETFLLGEVKACFSYNGIRYPLFFWRNYNGLEVDLLWENKEGFVAIEIKAAERWDKKFNRGLVRLTEELGEDRVKRYGVYMGERRLMWNGIEIMPVMDFLHRLWQGRPGEI